MPDVVGLRIPGVFIGQPSGEVQKVPLTRLLFQWLERHPLYGVRNGVEFHRVGGGVGREKECLPVIVGVKVMVVVVDALLLEPEGVHECAPVVVLLFPFVLGDDVHILLEK